MSDDVEDGPESPHEVPADPANSTPDFPAEETSQPIVAVPTVPPNTEQEVAPTDSEALPEWEELTPELLEDECLRGDFMLRWATILLAVLLGWSYLTETSVLVEIKSGEYMLDHGVLPPRVDPFAAPTAETPWVNLHWGTDLIVGLIHRIGGITSLSIVSALKVGFAFWILSRIGYSGVTTWWPSICAGVAVIAAFPVYQPGTMSVTILGLSAMLYLLHQLDLKPDSKGLYALPLLMILWANLDARAWIGIAFLLVYALVSLLTQPINRHQIIVLTAAFVLPVVLHPWPLQPALGFQETIAAATERQAQGATENLFNRYVIGMKEKDFWIPPDAMVIAQGVLLFLSFGAIFLNASRLHWGWVASWLGMNALAFQFGEMIPYAAIVNCVIAALQGQDWYRNSYSMEYNIATWPVLYSRAGRALTVLCFFAIAYGGINGFLFGVEGRRIGLGLDPRLNNNLESTEEELLPGIYGDRVFNVRADQGDMLIWLNRKPYVDSRFGLFVNGQTNFAEKHRAIRSDIFPVNSDSEAADESKVTWENELAALEISSVMLRLWGESPGYQPFAQIFIQPQWVMTSLGAAGAVFTRKDVANSELLDFVDENDQTNFFAAAFAKNKTTIRKLQERFPTWPNPPSDYDRWLIQKMTVRPNSIQIARHYFSLASLLMQLGVDNRIIGALAELSLQNATQGIQEQPNGEVGYRLLRDAHLQLGSIDSLLIQQTGGRGELPMRMELATYAAFHAARASGDAPDDLLRLFQILLQQNRIDVALDVAKRFAVRTGQPISAAQTDDAAVIEAGNRELDTMSQQVQIVEEQIANARTDKRPLQELVQIAHAGNCPGLALAILEEDLTQVAGNPDFQLSYAGLLLQCGRISEGWEQFEQMSELVDRMSQADDPLVAQLISQWRELCGYANLGVQNPLRATELWSQKVIDENRSAITKIVGVPPLAANPPQFQDLWPSITSFNIATAIVGFPDRWATFQLQNALVRIDSGLIDEAISDLERILEVHPEYHWRSLVVLTLVSLTGKEYEFYPPSDKFPVWGGMFAEDDPETPPASQPVEQPSTPADDPKQEDAEEVGPPRPPQPELPQSND